MRIGGGWYMVELGTYTLDRYAAEEIAQQVQQWVACTDLVAMMNAIPQVLLILNDRRQVVFANRVAVETAGADSPDSLLGMRPGELLECEHAREGPGGCGTTKACSQCGAFQALVACGAGATAAKECRLIQFRTGRPMLFRISSTPFELGSRQYCILSMTDMSDEHRRRNLERIFFHDLLNIVGAMTGYVQLLEEAEPAERPHLSQSVLRLADNLVEEIRSEQELTLAESGELPVRPGDCSSREVLQDLAGVYRKHPVANGKFIFMGEGLPDIAFRTDRRLLGRVVGNMLKNALEASKPGEHVMVGCALEGSALDFWVHSNAAMPSETQLQVFHRAFSTKGTGRGLGTYSMKLLCERYLKGEVSFSSGQETGTTFHVRLPIAGAATKTVAPTR